MDEAPQTDAPRRPSERPANRFIAAPSTADLGTWGDPTDVADRQAFEQARREQVDARPPHW